MPYPSVEAFRCSKLFSGFLRFAALCTVCFLAVSFSPAAEPKHPDFSGTWVLDRNHSDFGPLPVPSKMVDVLEQSGTELKVRRVLSNDDREADYEFNYKFDGSEVINKASLNHPKSRSHWESGALIVETDLQVEGLPLKIVDRWRLDGECSCLVISRHFQTEQGEMSLLLTMTRLRGGSKE